MSSSMEPATQRSYRGMRTNGHLESGGPARRAHHGNRRWLADGVAARGGTSTPHTGSDSERWERGGSRGGGRGRGRGSRGKFGNATVTFRRNGALDGRATESEGEHSEVEEEHEIEEVDLNELETPEERERFWQELVKAREAERKKAIVEGNMDDPSKPKRLEDAITMVGTCTDMCPRFERYRRERENNLFEWETIPGTKRVDHKRAVKAYERAAGDKTLPSDLRPPHVLKRTLDYLFHELLPNSGFSETFNFIRDRSRAVRTDFTMQHEMGPIAIECHDRCARFHILAIHIERNRSSFSITMEEQQLMNTLQSLKEFYEDQRSRYQSPTELEMRVYHRLVHIRDQKERHDDIPPALINHPVFELTTKFRARVQAKSAPITKTSPLLVDDEAMHIFAELADVLRREGNVVMTYLVACILERHFGKDTIENIESIRNSLSLSDIIDGNSGITSIDQDTDIDISIVDETEDQDVDLHEPRKPLQPSGTQWLTDSFGPKPTESAFFSRSSVAPAQSAFSNLTSIPNAFGAASFGTQSAFTKVESTAPPISVFGLVKDSNAPALKNAETCNAAVGFPPSSSVASLPLLPPPGEAPSTIFTSQVEQPLQTTKVFPTQTPQDNGFPAIPKRSTIDPKTPTAKPLNPLAPTFNPTPNLAASIGASVLDTSPTSVFGRMPSTSSSESHKRDTFGPDLNESLTSISSQPTQEQSKPDATTSGIPFVSSPPSMISTSLEGAMDQTPPVQPPPLTRRQPISLPTTPTASVFIPSLASTRKPTLVSLKNLHTASLSTEPTEVLSPLVLHSPFSRSLASMPGLTRRESMQSPLKAVVSAADLEATAEVPSEKLSTSLVAGAPPAEKAKPNLDIMRATALHFTRRSWVIKRAFSKWRERLSDHARWLEACRRSTEYKDKARAERLSRSVGGSPVSDGRAHGRVPTETRARAPLKKRLRARLSNEYRPVNDEALARRFEKNLEEHARRWARGSFLAVLEGCVASRKGRVPENWAAWLSLNQENDGTAIWVEQKFDVPDSGRWRTEHVFEIPMEEDREEVAKTYPGVVIFERTPLMGVTDLLGRKYRVLEDCTRLREIIEAFPADRHYVPSLVCIAWPERDPDASKDFDDMVASMVGGGMLASVHELVISMAALDMERKLEQVLQDVPFDVEGRLVRRVSLNDLFKIREHEWEETTTKWLGDCVVYGEFHWGLYGKLLEGCTRLLIKIIDAVIGLLRDDGDPTDLDYLRPVRGMDPDTTFDVVLDWLQSLPQTDFTASLIVDVRAHRDLDRDFPTMTFLTQVYALGRSVAGQVAGVPPEAVYFVSRSRLEEVEKSIEEVRTSLEGEMVVGRMGQLKPTKRMASFTETSSSRTSPSRSKKQRVSSLSDGSPTDEEMMSSPPLSTTTSVPSEPTSVPIVTPAMLRTLTQDLRVKYGVGKASLSR